MAHGISSPWKGLSDSDRQRLAQLLTDPATCSETLVRHTLERSGAQGFDLHDVQEILQAHMDVLRDALTQGGRSSA